MKISKLFHWLYAIVMLLPIFAIGITCGYAMFNKNAYQSYYAETINEETKHSGYLDSNTYYYINVYEQRFENTLTINVRDFNVIGNCDSNIIENKDYVTNLTFYYYNNSYICRVDYNNEHSSTYWYYVANLYQNTQFSFYITNNIQNQTFLNSLFYFTYNNSSFLSEVFYYSVDKVTQSPYFNWAYDSFLVVPFSYIVNLFSMPINSPVVMLLSYWLSISIIWLTFDLVMYVPLLVHRWLDKGVLE